MFLTNGTVSTHPKEDVGKEGGKNIFDAVADLMLDIL